MSLVGQVHIARRFQRAVRIDTDLGDAKALEGFICPRTSADVLLTMARHVAETGQGAFTWTGPYGSGKSSLVVALSALLNGNLGLRQQASNVLGNDIAGVIGDALPSGAKGWRILPVVGRRDHPARVIGEAIDAAGLATIPSRGEWSEPRVVDTLVTAAARSPKTYGGLVLFIDEMGKFLESAAQDNTDIYMFQQLAEAASRSNKRLIVVGVLHQAFEEYAHRLSHQMRDEWAKIQGRFIDLAVNTAGEEQIDLISRAIETDHRSTSLGTLAQTVAAHARRDRPTGGEYLAKMLERCWPLHPVVTCLLGPISRRRFGQNQRSIFGFLNSAEPQGFQDFLKRAADSDLYGPDQLWDYLRANLEPSILASPDGHRWAVAAEALERCEAVGGDDLHLRLLKTIGVVDLFKERSGLLPTMELLCGCHRDSSDAAVKKALDQLKEWSFVIYKKFSDAYAIFAGSDFDIDQAVRVALDESDEIDFAVLKSLAGLQPVLAKRHYHETGALRWFDVHLLPLSAVINLPTATKADNGTIGQFILAIPDDGQSAQVAADICREAAGHTDTSDVIVGLSNRSWAIADLARELIALEKVSNDRAELRGDDVARREVTARLATLQGQLETELRRAFDGATWFRKHSKKPKAYRHAELTSLASDLADRRFDQSPRLHNELLNRHKPSSNAIAAQNVLLRHMVLDEGQVRLGIEGFPAEGGLFASLLEATRLYAKTPQGWRFVAPKGGESAAHLLGPVWDAASKLVEKNAKRTVSVSEIYDLWRQQPFGMKDGLMPVLVVAFILSRRDSVAVYRDGIFRARFDDVDVEHLAKDPQGIQLRWMDLTEISRKLLSGMAEIVRELDAGNSLTHLEPIDVARGLVAIHERLHPWTKRTMRLSANAIRVRDLFKRARDPNKFLFDDIPETLGGVPDVTTEAELLRVVSTVREGLKELVQAYPAMLFRLRDSMLAELEVPNASSPSLAELRDRAENIRQVAGDFSLDAVIVRLMQFDGGPDAVEGIASLLAKKPSRDWVDPDLDRAGMEIADMAQKFLRAETFARVKGRPDKRQSMAVVIGMDGGRPTPILEEFNVADADRATVNDVIARVQAALEEGNSSRRNVILAALAQITARYMRDQPAPEPARHRAKGRPAT